MITEFKLIGLVKPNTLTCEPMDREDYFNVKSHLSKERFDALFEYCGGNWQERKIVVIEHDGLTKDGIPLNPKSLEIKLAI